MTLMYRSTHKDSKKLSFTILRFFYNLLCIFKVFSHNMHKKKKKRKHFCLEALAFSQTRSQRIGPCRHYSYEPSLRNWTQRRVSIRILVHPLLPYGTRVEHGLGSG
jgi:hypothetical protein